MERDELRTTLVNHLETLRRNLQVVSMEVLKTKYKKPFDVLRQDICKAATAYTRFLVFDGMRIKHKYFDEAVPYIDAAVKQTKRLKQISDAAFQRQDIDEIESLALALRKEIEAALQPFYMGHMCLYVTPECFDDPPKTPEIFLCQVGTKKILRIYKPFIGGQPPVNGLRFLYALVPFFVRRFLYAAANASIIGVTGSSLSGLDRYSNRMPFSRNFRSNLMKEEVSRLIREVSRVRIVPMS